MARQSSLPQTHPCWDIGKLSWRQGCSADEVSLNVVQSDRETTTAAWTAQDAPIPVAQFQERAGEIRDHQRKINSLWDVVNGMPWFDKTQSAGVVDPGAAR